MRGVSPLLSVLMLIAITVPLLILAAFTIMRYAKAKPTGIVSITGSYVELVGFTCDQHACELTLLNKGFFDLTIEKVVVIGKNTKLVFLRDVNLTTDPNWGGLHPIDTTVTIILPVVEDLHYVLVYYDTGYVYIFNMYGR